MPRKMGIKRIMRRGESGQKGVLNKLRKMTLPYLQKGKVTISESPKYFRKRATLITSKAMDAAGLDTSTKKHRAIRKSVHRLVQNLVNLNYLHATGAIGLETLKLARALMEKQMIELIVLAKGSKGVTKFRQYYGYYSNLISRRIVE